MRPWGLFHAYFLGYEIDQLVKAKVLYARILGPEFKSPRKK